MGAGPEEGRDGVVGEVGGVECLAQTKGQVRQLAGPAPVVGGDGRQTVGWTGRVGVGSLTGAGGAGVLGPSLSMETSRCLEM